MIPFFPILMQFQNPRVSDFMLKIQFSIMCIFYILLSLLLFTLSLPFIYIKLVINSVAVNMIQVYERDSTKYDVSSSKTG